MISPAVVDVIKLASGFAVSSGVSTMVGYAAKSSVPKIAPHIIRSRPMLVSGWKIFQKIAIPAGAAALAGMASEQAVKYADEKIDENVQMVNRMQERVDAAKTKAKAEAETDKPDTEETPK